MIDIYTQGSQIGISIHGLSGFFLLTYFIIEMIFLFSTKSLLIHKILIYIRLHKELKKVIPVWWKVDQINILTIERKSIGYEVYVKVSSKIEKRRWTNDFVIVDHFGRIKSHSLSKSIKINDRGKEMEIKKWKRNKMLKDIGI